MQLKFFRSFDPQKTAAKKGQIKNELVTNSEIYGWNEWDISDLRKQNEKLIKSFVTLRENIEAELRH